MSRTLRVLVVVALLAPWAAAAALWGELPELIPFHYDFAGRPDDWVERSLLTWFALPALASLLGAVIGLGLPRWVVRMARANSPWLNVPNRARFRELPEDARARAVAVPAGWLSVLAIELQAIFVWLLFGTHAVATSKWQSLSALPVLLLIGLLVATVVAFGVHSHRAVQREFDRVRAAKA